MEVEDDAGLHALDAPTASQNLAYDIGAPIQHSQPIKRGPVMTRP